MRNLRVISWVVYANENSFTSYSRANNLAPLLECHFAVCTLCIQHVPRQYLCVSTKNSIHGPAGFFRT